MHGVDGEILRELSERWGPAARICVQLARNPWTVEACGSEVKRAASDFVKNFDLADDMVAGVVSHLLFAVRPQDKGALPEERLWLPHFLRSTLADYHRCRSSLPHP